MMKEFKHLKGHGHEVVDLSWNEQNEIILASCDSGGILNLWNTSYEYPIDRYTNNKGANFICCCFDKFGKYVCTCSNDKTVKVFEIT